MVVKEVTTETAAAGAAEGTTAQVSGASLGGTIGFALNVVMWAYLAYQIADILVKIIWECEPEEFELGTKRDLKTCTYLGSYCADKVAGVCIERRQAYCCYSSPLSRILNEQVRSQLGIGYGSKESPNCDGIAVADLERVDWDRINLDEWMGILTMTGHLPTAGDVNLTAEALTGSGSALDIENPRPNVVTRTQDRLEGSGMRDINTELRDRMWQQAAP